VEHGVPRERGGERGGAVEPAPGDQQASGRTGIVAAVTGVRQMLDTVSTGLGLAVSVGLDATQKAGSIITIGAVADERLVAARRPTPWPRAAHRRAA